MSGKIDKNYKQVYARLFKDIQIESGSTCFDEAALPSYLHANKLMSWLFWNRINTAFSLAGDIKNKSVLDFGCGGAVTFLYLQANNCQITGCENQFADLSRAISNRLQVNASICADVFSLGTKFDTIFALDVLEHVENLETIVAKLKELLSEKGQLIISGPTENILYKLGRKLAGFSGHYHVRNIYDIESACSQTGLIKKTVKTLYWPMPLFRISLWNKQ